MQNMKNAILAVRRGAESISSAARKNGVPKSTLWEKISGRCEENCKLGRKPLLSEVEEDILVRWIIDCKKRGFPITKEQVMYSAGRIITGKGKTMPSLKDKLGSKWYALFMGRHKNLSVLVRPTVRSPHSTITKEIISQWCDEVKKYCKENSLMDVFKDPRRIFNCDEIAFFLAPKTEKVIATRGDKSVYNVSGNTDKENVTVLMNVRADGDVAPPMVLYAYEKIPLHVGLAVPDEWGLGKSESGWMTSETFFEYLANTFEPYLTANNIPRPVVLFLDGFVSYMSFEISDFCASKKIELLALLPNATHILQPLNVAVFNPLVNVWKKAVADWGIENNDQNMKKEDFPPILQSVMNSTLKPEMIKNGFRTCGLVNLNIDDIDVTKIVDNLSQN